jgi:hypothetical protein
VTEDVGIARPYSLLSGDTYGGEAIEGSDNFIVEPLLTSAQSRL